MPTDHAPRDHMTSIVRVRHEGDTVVVRMSQPPTGRDLERLLDPWRYRIGAEADEQAVAVDRTDDDHLAVRFARTLEPHEMFWA